MSSLAFTSCDDFLTVLPTGQIPEQYFFKTKADLDNVRAGAYDKLASSTVLSKILLWGEARGDNFELNNKKQTNIDYLMQGVLQPTDANFDWSAFYTGINYCNLVIQKGDQMTVPGDEVDPSFRRTDYNMIKAEMMALRSLYYFYLVRAYRDVPYITEPISSDEEATRSYPAATPGVAVLDVCIDSLEANVQYTADNFGSNSENKGRFTKLGVHALLADMYLWRACLLNNYLSKPNLEDKRVNYSDVPVLDETGASTGKFATADGQELTAGYCTEQATACLNKSKEHANWVLDQMKSDYKKDFLDKNPTLKSPWDVQPYPFYTLNADLGFMASDQVYGDIFGAQNSSESILELQYDGSTTKNTIIGSYFSSVDNNQISPSIFTIASSPLLSGINTVAPVDGFGKTDYRVFETCNIGSSNSSSPVYPITKFRVSGFSLGNPYDMSQNKSGSGSSSSVVSFSLRTTENAHWPIYRLSDIMLIKAEAIARLGTTNVDTLAEGYRLVNEIYRRSNPKLVPSVDDAEADHTDLVSTRINNYGTTDWKTGAWRSKSGFTAADHSAASLLTLLYQERQREFACEGKRWFDIVRQVEWSNDPKTTLSTFITLKNSIRTRLSNLWGLYVPIYSEEIKVNGVDYGGKLVQNPVWDRYTKK